MHVSAVPFDAKHEKSAGTIELAVSHESFINWMLRLRVFGLAIIGVWGAPVAGTAGGGVVSRGTRKTRRIVNNMTMIPTNAAIKRVTEAMVMVEEGTAPLR